MDMPRLEGLAQAAVRAAVANDQEALREALAPVYNEATSIEALAWVLGMIGLTTRGVERGGPGVAVPAVAYVNDDGELEHKTIEEAPHGVRAYVRIMAAWINDDRPTAVAVWGALIEDEDDPDGEELHRCMMMALHAAAARVKADQARLQ